MTMDVLAQDVDQALENAGLSGLCRDGQIELAAEVVRARHPEWNADQVTDFIEARLTN
jgi:hypothetical protein